MPCTCVYITFSFKLQIPWIQGFLLRCIWRHPRATCPSLLPWLRREGLTLTAEEENRRTRPSFLRYAYIGQKAPDIHVLMFPRSHALVPYSHVPTFTCSCSIFPCSHVHMLSFHIPMFPRSHALVPYSHVPMFTCSRSIFPCSHVHMLSFHIPMFPRSHAFVL